MTAIFVASLLLPVMVCFLPGTNLTTEEAECCKKMASDCGEMQMPNHSCCQSTTASTVLKGIEPSKSFETTISLPAQALAFFVRQDDIQSTLHPTISEAFHPPLVPPPSIDILRI